VRIITSSIKTCNSCGGKPGSKTSNCGW